MRDALLSLFRQLQALRRFESKYQPGDCLACVHGLSPDGLSAPAVSFYGDRPADRAWVFATLGDEGWSVAGESDGWQHLGKTVEGVRVTLYRAGPLGAPAAADSP